MLARFVGGAWEPERRPEAVVEDVGRAVAGDHEPRRMPGAGVAEPLAAGVEDGDEGGGEGVGLVQAGVVVEAGEDPGRAGLDGGEGPQGGPERGHDDGRLHPVAGHVPHHDPDHGAGQGQDVVPVAAHRHGLPGRKVPGGERQTDQR